MKMTTGNILTVMEAKTNSVESIVMQNRYAPPKDYHNSAWYIKCTVICHRFSIQLKRRMTCVFYLFRFFLVSKIYAALSRSMIEACYRLFCSFIFHSFVYRNLDILSARKWLG